MGSCRASVLRMSINRNQLGQAPLVVWIAMCALAPSFWGCETEERVVSSRGSLLGGQPGAVGGREGQGARLSAERREAAAAQYANNPMGYKVPDEYDPLTLRYSVQGEGERIVSRNPRELFFHLRRALIDGDREMLLGQILSAETIATYQELGRDPGEAADFLLSHREQMVRTLQVFPMGEMTPGFYPKPIGRNSFRLEAPPGFATPPLRFRRVDYVYERDACRLLLIH